MNPQFLEIGDSIVRLLGILYIRRIDEEECEPSLEITYESCPKETFAVSFADERKREQAIVTLRQHLGIQ